MLISMNLRKKSGEVSVKTRSTPASLSCKGKVTKHTTVKRSIAVITVEPADKIPFVYNCMQTRLRGQYNGK